MTDWKLLLLLFFFSYFLHHHFFLFLTVNLFLLLFLFLLQLHFAQHCSELPNPFIHAIGPLIVQLLDVLQFPQRFPHLPEYDFVPLHPLFALLLALYLLGQCSPIVYLRVVEPRGCLIGDHDVPLEIVGLYLLQVIQHPGLGIGLELNGIEDLLQLSLVLLLRLDQLLFKKSEDSVHPSPQIYKPDLILQKHAKLEGLAVDFPANTIISPKIVLLAYYC